QGRGGPRPGDRLRGQIRQPHPRHRVVVRRPSGDQRRGPRSPPRPQPGGHHDGEGRRSVAGQPDGDAMTPHRRWAAALLAGTALVAPAVAAGDGVNWEAVAQCESGGDWSAATGNGDFGGLQISESTWRANGGAEMAAIPAEASPAEQVDVAKHIL